MDWFSGYLTAWGHAQAWLLRLSDPTWTDQISAFSALAAAVISLCSLVAIGITVLMTRSTLKETREMAERQEMEIRPWVDISITTAKPKSASGGLPVARYVESIVIDFKNYGRTPAVDFKFSCEKEILLNSSPIGRGNPETTRPLKNFGTLYPNAVHSVTTLLTHDDLVEDSSIALRITWQYRSFGGEPKTEWRDFQHQMYHPTQTWRPLIDE